MQSAVFALERTILNKDEIDCYIEMNLDANDLRVILKSINLAYRMTHKAETREQQYETGLKIVIELKRVQPTFEPYYPWDKPKRFTQED